MMSSSAEKSAVGGGTVSGSTLSAAGVRGRRGRRDGWRLADAEVADCVDALPDRRGAG